MGLRTLLRASIALALPLTAAGLRLTHAHTPAASMAAAQVTLIRVPHGGLQPQVAVDARHVLHLIYLDGDPGHANVEYVISRDDGASFSSPLRVNSEDGSAIAVGNMRGPHLALGVAGHVHVAWASSNNQGMLYTRLDSTRDTFEPQRSVTRFAHMLDGGALAADRFGHVYVVWHGNTPAKADEPEREVWVAESSDGGRTFQPERPAWAHAGVCGCCGMAAFADRAGDVFILYRAVAEHVHRDMYLLESRDHGRTFSGRDVSRWDVNSCVMSTSAFAPAPGGPLAAWESDQQVYFARINPQLEDVSSPIAAPGDAKDRKHPVIATNARGDMLLAWTEGMGWKRGGALAWQAYNDHGEPLGPTGHADGVPTWSLVAAFARRDGSFAILY